MALSSFRLTVFHETTRGSLRNPLFTVTPPGAHTPFLFPFMNRYSRSHYPVPSRQRLQRRSPSALSVAQGLGWFSIGLGLAQVLAPGRVSRAIGLRRDHHLLMRLLGIREITSGLGILSQRHPAPWAWSRVAGDAMDLALLSRAFTGPRARRNRLVAATAAVAGVAAADLFVGQKLSRSDGDGANGAAESRGPIQVTHSITIDRPREQLYAFWRDFENLPRFMASLKSVRTTDAGRSHWVARGPMGKSVEWDAEVIHEHPDSRIEWRSLPGADIENSGSVEFLPALGGRGTVVRVHLEYQMPGGKAGSMLAKLMGSDPSGQVRDDLRFFKQLMETGVIATTRGQPAGRKRGTSWKFDHRTPEITSSPESPALLTHG